MPQESGIAQTDINHPRFSGLWKPRRISERESRESGSCKRFGSSQASALTWTTTLGEKRAGRQPRGCDSRPGSRARANRLRYLLTIWRGVSRRAAMMSLERPCAASNTIFARTTSQYGDVYWRALNFQHNTLFPGEDYREWAFPWHKRAILRMPSLALLPACFLTKSKRGDFKPFAKPPPAIRWRDDGDGRLASRSLHVVRAMGHPTVRCRRREESGRR
jgi:hypothetical protein